MNDIEFECGNALYQPILDRYIAGEDVSFTEVQKVEASRRNLAKANARWRRPRPWRCETETQLIRHVTLKWCNDIDRKWSGRRLARILGVSQRYIWKLTQQFKDGNLNVRSPLGSASTLEELGKALGSARRQTREMRKQGLLRETTRQMIARVLGEEA